MAVVVNPVNKVESLTLEQIRMIFAGEIEDWNVIGSTGLTTSGGAAGRINACGLRDTNPAAAVFYKECLPADKFKRVTLKKDTAEVLAVVSMDPQAIGFVDLATIPTTGQTAKVLGIRMKTGKDTGLKPVPPTAENIKNAMYPLSQRLYLYVHPQASDTAKDFAKFIASCGGSEATPYADTVAAVMDTYRKHGLISLADAALERAAKDATTRPASAVGKSGTSRK